MPSPPKHPAQRRRRHKAPDEQPKRAHAVALPSTSKRAAPAPPSWLAKRLHPAYRREWRSGVAHLWPPSTAELVARLVDERDRVRRLGDDAKPALRSIVLQLERELLLAPRTARVSGVTMRELDAPDVDELEPVDEPRRRSRPAASSIDAKRRERILRAVK